MSGRQQDLVKKPSQTNSRDEQLEFGNDNYAPHHHDPRNKQPMQYQESLSHHRSRYRNREMPDDPHERRVYGWNARNGRGDQFQLRPTPPVARSEKRPNIDERVLSLNPPQAVNRKRYDYVEYDDYNDGSGRHGYADHESYNKGGQKRQENVEYEEYNYGHRRNEYADNEYYINQAVRKSNPGYRDDVSVQINKEEYSDRRYLADNDHDAMAGNLVPVEDGGYELGYGQNHGRDQGYEQDPRRVRVLHGRGPGQGYEHDLQETQAVRSRQDRGQGYEHDPQPVRLRQDRGYGNGYDQDRQPVRLRQDCGYGQSSQSYPTFEMRKYKDWNEDYQEIPPEEYYKDKGTCAQRSRKFSHPSSPPQHKDYGNQSFSKGPPPSTSSGVIREEFHGGHHGVDIHSIDGYPMNPEPSENFITLEYGERPHLEPRKDFEVAGSADIKCRHCDPYPYLRSEHDDYAHAYAESRGKHHPEYRTNNALYREDRTHVQEDSEYRYMPRVVITEPIAENSAKAEGSHRIYRNDRMRELEISPTEESQAYEGPGRPVGSLTQEVDHLNSIYVPAEFARRASQEIQLNEASVLPDIEMSGYDKGRYMSVAKTQGEGVKISAESVDPEDVQKLDERDNRYSDEQVAGKRMVKRKYLQDEEAREFSLGTKASHKWNTYNGSQQIEDSKPEWKNRNSSGLHSQPPSGCETNLFLEAKDMINEITHSKGTESSRKYGWSDQGKCENRQEQSVKSYEPGRKYMKVHPKFEYTKDYGRSHYNNHRNDQYKQHYNRGVDENRMDVARDHKYSEDPKGPLNYDTCEDSEAFKQSVLGAFLMYSKKLNDSPLIRRLYKHQGNSGNLFCIVCGRSNSKVFQDTEGLTRHSFMARKASLRAQHLGLHRALCVLMGWGPEVPPEAETWMPKSLPNPEAMAQKEDLLIWQPTVIVHNISLSNNNHQEWKAISLETLESFIIAKNFIKSKIKICLGHPGDQSVMLVKFLGTFTGLQEAEQLHKYFAENGRGRAEFEHAISEMNSETGEGGTVEEEELLLYGYIGIAEDLDRIDLDTKKRCKIQSKKEIQVLVDAPLKRD